MKMLHLPGRTLLLGVILLIFFSIPSNGQEYDTLSNWDGIVQNWYVSTPGSEVVTNPAPDEINTSEHCLKVITGEGPYDYMISDLAEPVNFDLCPRYRLKVLAPLTGGNITLKFENYNNTFWQEIVLTPIPGEWTDLEYDFTGLVYNDLTRMVIFPDFQGTTPGIAWYIDDVLREACVEPGPIELESNLPIVVINTFGIPVPNEPKITAHMGVIDNGPGSTNNLADPFNNYNGNIGIEIRGHSSQQFPKYSYALETRDSTGENLDVALLGLPEENDWIFYAPYSDKSMLRNFVSFEMGRMMGHYCTRSVFFELVVNNDYKGVYTLMEEVKKDENRVDISTLNPNDTSGIELTGGYILKVDWVDPDFIEGINGWTSKPVPAYPNAKNIIFQYYYPDPDEIAGQQRNYIKDFITTAENTLTASTFSNPDNGYQKYFDVLSFIDYMFLCEISKEVDKYRFSTFFYKEKDSDGGKLFAGPAWDFDLGYGNVDYWSPGIDHTGWFYMTVEPHEWSIIFWWKRLMEDPYFRDLAKTRFVFLRQHQLSYGNLQTKIDSLVAYLGDARVRNYERWPILGKWVWPNYNWYGNTYEDEVFYFEDFMFRRMSWMEENLPGAVLHPAAGIAAEGNKLLVRLYSDYFSRQELKKDNFRLNNAPGNAEIENVTYKDADECILTLSENVGGFPDISVTISEEAVDYWEDITSSTLATSGLGDDNSNSPEIKIFENDQVLHILCDQPGYLPETAVIFNMAGQSLLTFQLENVSENILPHQLNPGIYLAVFNTPGGKYVLKFPVGL